MPSKADLRRAGRGADQLWLHLVGNLPGHRLRRALLRAHGMEIPAESWVYSGLKVRAPEGISLGRGTMVGFDARLDGRGGLRIGDHVNLSSEVAIWTADHDPHSPGFDYRASEVVVEDRAWLSFRSTVLQGVTVGRGAVVSAGALVVSDVPPLAIVGGVPAKVIGTRPDEFSYDLGRPLPLV